MDMRLRESNNNWKGGKSTASNGYVIVRVGVEHHLSDVRGYAYEHRLVAEQVLGRRLEKGEIVHHLNGIKTDNRPENLEVVSGHREHRFKHRLKESCKRIPGEPNPTIHCKCGCGSTFEKYDAANRPREYVSGHNPMEAPTEAAILSALSGGELSRPQIQGITGFGIRAIATCLSKLKRKGSIRQVRHGVWGLNEPIPSEIQSLETG